MTVVPWSVLPGMVMSPVAVGGGDQGQEPPQAGQGEQQAGGGYGGPEPAAVLAEVTAGLVIQQGAVGEGRAEHAGGGGHARPAAASRSRPNRVSATRLVRSACISGLS